MGKHICPAGWDNWRNPENEKTARYAEYGNTGEGADNTNRVKWVKQLTRKDVAKYEEPDYLSRYAVNGNRKFILRFQKIRSHRTEAVD